MKKLAILLIVLLLTGCSNQKTTNTVCKIDEDNASTEYILDAMGDKLSNFTEKLTINYEYYSVSGDEDIDAVYNELLRIYTEKFSVDGVSIDIEKTEDAFVVTVAIDYSKANIKDLQSVGLVSNEENITYVSLELTINELTNLGYVCE